MNVPFGQMGDERRRCHAPSFSLLLEQIAQELDPEGVQHLGGTWSNMGQRWTFGGAITATDRLIGILEKREEYERIFGAEGPKLAGSQLHPWVWDAAAACGMTVTTSLLFTRRLRLWNCGLS